MKFSRFFPLQRIHLTGGIALLFLLATGCSMLEKPFIPLPIPKPVRPADTQNTHPSAEDSTRAEGTNFYQTPKPPPAIRTSAGRPAAPPLADNDDAVATITLDNLPLPQFINVIYGSILKRNVSMDAQVTSRTDMVTFRTGKPQTAPQIFVAAQALLRSYGIAVYDYNGTLRVTPENSQAGMLPEIRRGKASPEVPASLRPVFHLVEIQNVQIAQVSTWLKTLFQGRLTVQDDNARNALLLSGQSDTVVSAMEVIQMLDQPVMRGRLSARIVPIFWSADEMARRLSEVLQAEGYSVALQASSNHPILILPIGPINSIITFAGSEDILNHILRWARDLDQSPQGRMGNFINYQVRNTDASELAKTLGEVMGMAPTTKAGEGGSAGAASRGKVVVNPAANSIIIQTTPSEFQQWYGLLKELDRPARNALIMATVAEVTLNDNEVFGFQWLVKEFMSHGYRINLGTTNQVGTSAADSTFRIGIGSGGGDPRALLTALATADKLRILSNPSVMARNGQDATIQVGDEVPILTSQLSSGNMSTTESGTNTNILQTVQYRSTGVILNVKPVIHAGGRIDLDVSQEVSTVGAAGIGGSPTISTRRVQTKLTVQDGNTLLLGGLMREERTESSSGLPWLKDIPFAGNLFRTSAENSKRRTELVILLTPYVVEDDFDAQAITEAFRNQFSWATPPAIPLKNVSPSAASEVGAASEAGGEVQETGIAPALESGATTPETRTEAEDVAPVSSPATAPVPHPEAKPAGSAAPTTYRSPPYPLPSPDAAIAPPAAPPVPRPDFAPAPERNESAPVSPETPSPALSSAPVSGAPPAEPVGRPITDKALQRELLEAIQKAQ